MIDPIIEQRDSILSKGYSEGGITMKMTGIRSSIIYINYE